jgi:drug/metabolite transporter (DMT)-like permease
MSSVSPTNAPSKSVLGFILMAAATASFMSANACAKILVLQYHWSQIVLLRGMTGCLFFIPVVLMGYCDRKNYPALSYPILILRAALEIVMFSTFILAIQSLSLGLAAALVLTTPIIVVMFASLFLGERLTQAKSLSIAMGIIGGYLIIEPKIGIDSTTTSALIYAAVSVSCLAVNSLLSRKYRNETPAAFVTIFVHIAMVAVSLPIVLKMWVNIPNFYILSMFVGVGIFGMIGILLFNTAFSIEEGGKLAPILYTELVWGLCLDFWLWDITPTATMMIGANIIVMAGLRIIRSN